jgi:capsular polysaccharide biosynthesis protein
MTFLELRTKLLKNSWIILISIILFNLVLLPKTNDSTFLASTTVGVSLNNPQYQAVATGQNSELASNYDGMLKEFSLYLSSRYQAPDIQSEIAKNLNKQIKIDTKKPFYEVKTQNAGYTNISYESGNRGEATDFNNSVVRVFNDIIIQEWNKDRPALFTVENTDKSRKFTSSINENKPSVQTSALPSVVGIFIGSFLALVLPIISLRKPS